MTLNLEDIDGLRHILEAGLLPKDVLTAMLMVDFWCASSHITEH